MRKLTKFTAFDEQTKTFINAEFWNQLQNLSNNDRVKIEYCIIQFGVRTLLTNSDYLKISVLESNLTLENLPSSTLQTANSDLKMNTYNNIKSFTSSTDVLGLIDGKYIYFIDCGTVVNTREKSGQ